MDQFIEHKVDTAASASALKTLLDSNSLAGWQLVTVVWSGSAYTVVSQRKGVTAYSAS